MATDKKKPAAKKPVKGSAKKTYTKKNKVYIAPYVLGCIAVFILLTFFFDTKTVGGWVKAALDWLVGYGKYFLPIYMFVIAAMWKSDRERNAVPLKTLLYSANILTLLMIIRLFGGTAGYCMDRFTDMMTDKAIGTIATWLLSLLLFFISLVLLCGSTPGAVVKAIVRFFRDMEYAPDKPEPASAPVKKARRTHESVSETAADGVRQRVFDLPELDPDDGKPEPERKPEINRDAPWAEAALPEVFPEPVKEPEPEEKLAEPDSGEPEEAVKEAEMAEDNPPDDAPDFETETVSAPETPYVFPPLSLLAEGDASDGGFTQSDIRATGNKLIETLESFGAKAKIVSTSCGPTVTRFELQPEVGVKVKQIVNLTDDIALHLSAQSVRVEAIPGKGAVGVEIPNRKTQTVRLHDMIADPRFRDSSEKLLTCLGRDVAGNPVYLDIKKMPHLLIAGATGMGKSVCLNSIIVSLLYRARPDEVKLILIDPKKLELADYNGLPHLLVPVVTEPKKAAGTLNWAVMEMERRFEKIQDVGARDSREYNETIEGDPEKEYMPDVVIFIDELADLMMTAPDDVETSICRLAQKARAAGMHLVIGTQRPSVDVITGLIKANVPSRIAFTVASRFDSDTILGQNGAEKLLGKGDMLYSPVGSIKPLRVQGAFVDGKNEVAAVTRFIKGAASVSYDESVIEKIEQEAKMCGVKRRRNGPAADDEASGGAGEDDKDDPIKLKAMEVALEYGTISTSLLQRRLSLGYAKAARIIDKLERDGWIGEFDPATKKRAVLMTAEELAEKKLNSQPEGDTEE